MRSMRFGAAVAVLATLLACQPQPAPNVDSAADVAAVNAVRQAEVAAITSGDTTLPFVTDDVVFMPPNEPRIVGVAAARSWAAGFLGAVTVQAITYGETNITITGDWAIEPYTGSLTVLPAGATEAVTEALKGVHIYRKGADGSWKMAVDIWNSDAPPPTS